MDPGIQSESLEVQVERERSRLRALPSAPYDLDPNRMGVLLSDEIEYYRNRFLLIDPWDPECLRPAGYDLRVGSNFSIGGVNDRIKDFESFTIQPYQVAVIETYESINMPRFLIGRWNIRVSLAYEGLLWVGGAQVNPGFRGHLCCPIYNLSDKPVTLAFKQPIAMIDFVTTTRLNRWSKLFDWEGRKKLIFSQYHPERLISGITTKIEKRLDRFENGTKNSIEQLSQDSQRELDGIRGRIDTFITAILTVLSVLVAALGVIATRQAPSSYLFAPVCIATLALFIALQTRNQRPANRRTIAIGLVVIVGALALDFHTQHVASEEVRAVLAGSSKAAEDANLKTQQIRSENEDLKLELEGIRVKLDDLQREIQNTKEKPSH